MQGVGLLNSVFFPLNHDINDHVLSARKAWRS